MATKKVSEKFSLKDQLFNRERIEYLAKLFQKSDRQFNRTGFVRDTMKELKELELKERIVHIAKTLESYLDKKYEVAVKKIVTALPPPLDPAKTDDDFGDFILAPLGEFVVRNGLESKHLKRSLQTLKELTQRFSMEDAVRYFINAHPERTLAELAKWSAHPNYHVRRLVSEGTRPLLPWSKRLSLDVAVPFPFLDTLHADPTRYVTRSVANHLNDIAKSQPKLVLDRLKKWEKEKKQEEKELSWMSKHALRTLVKQGDSSALKFLGYKPNPKIDIHNFILESTEIQPGQAIEFSFTVKASRDEALMIDYVIDFVKSNGKLAPKVYKLKQIELSKGESATVRKRHVLRANATTYTLYPGEHQVTLQINGKPFASKSFVLDV